jgi:hypothetical protein
MSGPIVKTFDEHLKLSSSEQFDGIQTLRLGADSIMCSLA